MFAVTHTLPTYSCNRFTLINSSALIIATLFTLNLQIQYGVSFPTKYNIDGGLQETNNKIDHTVQTSDAWALLRMVD